MSEDCGARAGGHCWHVTMTHAFSNGAGDRSEQKTHRCCFCGGYKATKFITERHPDHGPYGPKVMREVPA